MVEPGHFEVTEIIDTGDLPLGKGLEDGPVRRAPVSIPHLAGDLVVRPTLSNEFEGAHALQLRQRQRLHVDVPDAAEVSLVTGGHA